jgi:hypothetical protein
VTRARAPAAQEAAAGHSMESVIATVADFFGDLQHWLQARPPP